MVNPQIHPIALLAIGWYFCWIGKQKITAYTITGECLGVIFWLSIYPFIKYLVDKHFSENIEIASFAVYCKLMMMLMVGRAIEWGKCRTDDNKK